MTVKNVIVDFSVLTPKNNMSGFLHCDGVSAATMTPLKPAFLRHASNNAVALVKAQSLGATSIIVLSDAYGYPGQTPAWGGNPAPYGTDNYATWDALVQSTITAYLGVPNIYWDIWNEPDTYVGNFFWDGTQAQQFELYRRSYVAIKLVFPNAIIGGPSLANYDKGNTTLWLNYCYQNHLIPGFVAWHELGNADSNIPGVASDIAYFKGLYHGYPGFTATKFLITELVGNTCWLQPGSILAYLKYCEDGGADGSMKGCWNDVTTNTGPTPGQNTCFNGGLDGLLNASDGGKRAAYWAYRTYADGILNRVATTTDDPNMVALASRSAKQVLLGYSGAASATPTDVNVTLNHLDKAGFTGATVTVTIQKVPNNGEVVVSALTAVSASAVSITANMAIFTISALNLYEEYVIYLS